MAVRLPAASGGVAAFKFRDPHGHPLELIEFPSTLDRINSRDKRSEGIDHSAISVSDVDRSIAFYTALPGISLSARQINQSPEQCRLDGLDAALVALVALQPGWGTGMHLELLGYQADGTRPSRSKLSKRHGPADIATDRLVFEGITALPRKREEDHCEFMTNPDGHFIVLCADSARRV
jgi:catechol 2,3-dioxygenase-like lactoylglutathione lyase family enzyme